MSLKLNTLVFLATAAIGTPTAMALAGDGALTPLEVSAKTLPVPTADISPQMQAFIGKQLNPNWDKLWKTGEEARAFADAQAADTVKGLPAIRERLHVSSPATTMDGVRVHVLTPDTIPPETRDKVLIHPHGGCYVLFPGESGTSEGIMMAGLGHYEVSSVEVRG